ncbi:MAG: hypothetical protein Q9169_005861 [Polycauliona sp. 2 TL-2023]
MNISDLVENNATILTDRNTSIAYYIMITAQQAIRSQQLATPATFDPELQNYQSGQEPPSATRPSPHTGTQHDNENLTHDGYGHGPSLEIAHLQERRFYLEKAIQDQENGIQACRQKITDSQDRLATWYPSLHINGDLDTLLLRQAPTQQRQSFLLIRHETVLECQGLRLAIRGHQDGQANKRLRIDNILQEIRFLEQQRDQEHIPAHVRQTCPDNMTPARWLEFLDFCVAHGIPEEDP